MGIYIGGVKKYFCGILVCVYLWDKILIMAKAKKTIKPVAVETEPKENVKLKTAIVNLVRANKEKTGVPIGIFFEQAAMEKLKRLK